MAALMYRDVGMTMALGRNAGIPVPIGKVVGGTTTINSGTCFRVPEHVLDQWRARGDIELSGSDLDADYSRVEEFIEVAPVPEELLGGCARAVRRGAEKLGLHGQPLRRNARHCKGSGVCAFGCPTDAKRSANVSWVPAAVKAGARLCTGVRVSHLDLYGSPRGADPRAAPGQDRPVGGSARGPHPPPPPLAPRQPPPGRPAPDSTRFAARPTPGAWAPCGSIPRCSSSPPFIRWGAAAPRAIRRAA